MYLMCDKYVTIVVQLFGCPQAVIVVIVESVFLCVVTVVVQ